MVTETPFDLIVVGAGPGGSNAAAVAVRAGLRVAQIDRCVFPRVKPCGGGLTIKACRALQLDLQPGLRRSFLAVEFNVWQARRTLYTHRQRVLLKMIVRPEFDNMLVQQNREYPNFHFFDGERVLDIAWNGLFSVRTERRTLTARQLIGADGAYSLTNKAFRIARPKAWAAAVEVTIPRSTIAQDTCLQPCLDFGVLAKGYGWVFPKDDHWNVGLYTYEKGIKDLRARLADYSAAKGLRLQGDLLRTVQGHQLPVGGYRLAVPSCPVYLVGDAAGFADALTGEGIYHALESGRLAGETARDVMHGRGTHRRYYTRLWRSVLPDTFLTYHLARPFYANLDRGVRVFEHPLIWRSLVQGYAEGATVSGALLHGGRHLVASLRGHALTRGVPGDDLSGQQATF